MAEKKAVPKAISKPKGTSEVQGARAVKVGDVCCVHYIGRLDSGEVFDSSRERQPIEFVVGSGQLIKGFDTAVLGLKKGDKKDVHIEPAEAYGERDDRRVQNVPRSMLPKEPEPKEGMMLTITTPTGQMFPAKIEKVEKDVVTIDFNHPLAGKKLNFEIEVVEIKENEHRHDEGCGCGREH
jgi:peptidylprolyl isomerase